MAETREQIEKLATEHDTMARFAFDAEEKAEHSLIARALRALAEGMGREAVGYLTKSDLVLLMRGHRANIAPRPDRYATIPIYPSPPSAPDYAEGYAAGIEAAAKWHDDEAARLRSLDRTDPRLAEAAVEHEGSAHFIRALAKGEK